MSCIKFAETKGEARGEARGKVERNIEIAKSMKADGVDNAVIAKYTNLSIQEIECI